MQFSSEIRKLAAYVEKGGNRPYLNYIHIENGIAAASNGHALGTVWADKQDPDLELVGESDFEHAIFKPCDLEALDTRCDKAPDTYWFVMRHGQLVIMARQTGYKSGPMVSVSIPQDTEINPLNPKRFLKKQEAVYTELVLGGEIIKILRETVKSDFENVRFRLYRDETNSPSFGTVSTEIPFITDTGIRGIIMPYRTSVTGELSYPEKV